jgi:hypothetical protein
MAILQPVASLVVQIRCRSTADAAKKRAPVYFDRNGVAWYRRNNANLMIPVADQTAPRCPE